jgi:hypothetical protein
MNAPLPADIAVRELHGGGVRYEFPRRALGAMRLFGMAPLGAGAFFSLFAVGWMVLAAHGGGFMGWLFALWGVPFFFAGCVPMAIGLFILIGRCDVEMRDGVLRVTERAGLVRWSRRVTVDAVRRMSVRLSNPTTAPAFLGKLAALDADCGKPKPFLVAVGYPCEWLQAVGDDLARRCSLATSGQVFAPRKLAVETVVMPASQPATLAQEEDLNQPAGSKTTLEPQGDGFMLRVPPVGVWHGQRFLLIFSMVWCAFCALFTVLVAGSWDWEALPTLPVLAIFWAVGVGMMFVAIRSGRCSATIQATGDRLRIAYIGVFRAREQEWSRAELAAICAGPSGMEVNHRPVIELQVFPRAGRKFGLLAGRDVAELQWIAAVLRQALGVPSALATAEDGLRRNG